MGEQKKMLILRGNSDTEGKTYPDEKGNKIPWPDGALHEQAAKDYATARGYVGEVLDVSGDALPNGDRDNNPQTFRALCRLKNHDSKDWKNLKCEAKDNSKDEPYSAIYGFSGGGYDVLHILNHLNKDELKRIKLVVVLGAPPLKDGKVSATGYPRKSHFESSSFGKPSEGIEWELVYPDNQNPADASVLPKKGIDPHMFGPEWLLSLELFTQRTLRKHPSIVGGPGPWLKPPDKP